MDPNEYDSLLSTLVADFENINSEIIVFALVLLAGLIFVLRRDLALLDVLTLGKEQAINLGVDYDRSLRRLLLGSPWPSLWPRRWWGPSPSWGSSWPTSPGSC